MLPEDVTDPASEVVVEACRDVRDPILVVEHEVRVGRGVSQRVDGRQLIGQPGCTMSVEGVGNREVPTLSMRRGHVGDRVSTTTTAGGGDAQRPPR